MAVPIIPLLETRSIDELITLLISRSASLSGGLLYDARPGSALMGILSYNAALLADYGAALNLLPEATIRRWINLIGVQGATGSFARGEVEITLSGLFATPTTITQGFRLTIGGYPFQTTQTLVIPPFTGIGRVQIVATVIGKASNLPQKTPVLQVDPIAVISNIGLRDDTANGLDEPTLLELAELTNVAIRQRSLNSVGDFEIRAKVLLGTGSSAVVVRQLGKDRVTTVPGAVHVFGLNPDRSPLTNTQISNLLTQLSQDAGWATVFVSSMVVASVDGFVVVTAQSGANPNEIAASINTQLRGFITPDFVLINTVISVNRLVNEVFKVPGVADVGRVSLGNIGTNPGVDWVQPTMWTVPKLGTLAVRIILNNVPYEFNFVN